MSEHQATRPTTTEADLVAAAVLSCPAVLSLHAGGTVQRSTYLPGRRVVGVRLATDRIEVAVVGRLGIPVHELVDQVNTVLAPLADGRPVDVHVADVQAAPADPSPGGPGAETPASSSAGGRRA